MNGVFEKKELFNLTATRVNGFIGYPPMFHPHGELIYVIRGSIKMVIDGEAHVLREGDIFLLFPYLTHSYEDSPDAEAIIILFENSVSPFENILLGKKPLVPFANGEAYFNNLDRAVKLIREDKIDIAKCYVNAIIGELLDILPLVDRGGIFKEATVKILEYCTSHFNERISLKSVSKALYISESYVSKIFANKLKISFREYINLLRLDKAADLLKHTDKSVVSIMLECGYKNQGTFNRTFKDVYKISPSEYRKNMKP